MKNKLSGQITIEVSIVFPIVMMIVVSLIWVSFYINDVITIRSFAYSAGIQNVQKDFGEFEAAVKTKMKKVPTFILKTKVSCKEEQTCFKISVKSDSSKQIRWMKNIMGNNRYAQTIKIEKSMPKEILYGYRTICDELKEGRVE